MRSGEVPYTRLSSFYFFYFASVGAFVPYWGLYLQSLGYEATAIGELMAVIMATKIVAPNVWGWIADHTGHRLSIVRLASLIAAASFALLLIVRGYWGIFWVLIFFSFFWNAALPQFEAITLNHLGRHSHRYSWVRLWGSVGFILTVVFLGRLFAESGMDWLVPSVLALLVAIWLSTHFVPHDEVSRPGQEHLNLWGVLREPAVWGLLMAFFLVQVSHGPYYTFFSIYLEEHGYERGLIGMLWALGVVIEIVVFGIMHRWLPRYGAGNLLRLALGITAVRWVMIGAGVDHLAILLIAQTMHAASFGLVHASAIHLIHNIFSGRLQGRGQALYSSISFGLGGAVGSLMSGYIWTNIEPSWVYYTAAIMALAGLASAWWGLSRMRSGVSPLQETETWETLP